VEEVAAKKLGDEAELTWKQARQIVRLIAEMIGAHAQETARSLNFDIATGKPLLPTSNNP
jgi:hypothetical protein